MGARTQLNEFYLAGCFIVAGLVGLVFQSGVWFVITLVLLIGLHLESGAIRLPNRRR